MTSIAIRDFEAVAATCPTPVDLRRFNLRIERVQQVDDQGLPCDLFDHEYDCDGNLPGIIAQAYYVGRKTGLSLMVSGCLDCVRRKVADHANGDRLTVIEIGC